MWFNLSSDHVQPSSPRSIPWIWEGIFFIEGDANVLALGMFERIAVITHVASFSSKDAVITAEFTVLAWKPSCAALAKDDVARDHVFTYEQSALVLGFKVPVDDATVRLHIPPAFFAPRRFPGPSFAPLARPWA